MVINKYIYLLLTFIVCSVSFGQITNGINLQAVVRDNDIILKNEEVNFRLSILSGSATGSPVYIETHQVTSDQNGIVNLVIGQGTSTTDFSTVEWGDNAHFLRTELDIANTGAYTVMGVTQFSAVPYALHANSVTGLDEKLASLETKLKELENKVATLEAQTPEPVQIGDYKEGGIVFYVDSSGQHGYVISLEDLSDGVAWDSGTHIQTMARDYGNSYYGGAPARYNPFTILGAGLSPSAANTLLIMASEQTTSNQQSVPFAAKLCYDYENDIDVENKIYAGYEDWFLPSQWLLVTLSINKNRVNQALAIYGTELSGYYWSSTEGSLDKALVGYDIQASRSKSDLYKVRAVRKF
ncbi:MAG: DUF1566 domain-containing protein [Cytophagales bacterium]|nr:DUF1566 domain-containing protein [Cytophagales bacterium]